MQDGAVDKSRYFGRLLKYVQRGMVLGKHWFFDKNNFPWVIHRHIFEREVNKKLLGFAYIFFAPFKIKFQRWLWLLFPKRLYLTTLGSARSRGYNLKPIFLKPSPNNDGAMLTLAIHENL